MKKCHFETIYFCHPFPSFKTMSEACYLYHSEALFLCHSDVLHLCHSNVLSLCHSAVLYMCHSELHSLYHSEPHYICHSEPKAKNLIHLSVILSVSEESPLFFYNRNEFLRFAQDEARGIEPLGMTDRMRPFGFTSKPACELSEVLTEKEKRMTKRRKYLRSLNSEK